MREHKYRAWDKTNKMMMQPEYLVDLINGYAKLAKEEGIEPCIDDWEWLQYTGLKDKNGVEIYEGDVLGPNNREVIFALFENYWGYGNGWATLCHNPEYPHIPVSLGVRQIAESKIIGNIYENPELSDTTLLGETMA